MWHGVLSSYLYQWKRVKGCIECIYCVECINFVFITLILFLCFFKWFNITVVLHVCLFYSKCIHVFFTLLNILLMFWISWPLFNTFIVLLLSFQLFQFLFGTKSEWALQFASILLELQVKVGLQNSVITLIFSYNVSWWQIYFRNTLYYYYEQELVSRWNFREQINEIINGFSINVRIFGGRDLFCVFAELRILL